MGALTQENNQLKAHMGSLQSEQCNAKENIVASTVARPTCFQSPQDSAISFFDSLAPVTETPVPEAAPASPSAAAEDSSAAVASELEQ